MIHKGGAIILASKYKIENPMKTTQLLLALCLCTFSTTLVAQDLRVEADGTVRKNGSIVGQVYADGDVRVNGSLRGKIYDDGDVRKDGTLVGKLESDGSVRVNGSLVGKIEDNGSIYKNGSYVGQLSGVPKKYIAVTYFFNFFD